MMESEKQRTDTERLDFISDANIFREFIVFAMGKVWYWRRGHGQPHRRVNSLREAIDKAMDNKGL